MTADPGAPEDFGFAPAPFQPDEALQRARRDLRALGLVERQGVHERRGQAIARVMVDGQTLRAARVKQPRRQSPEWLERTLRHAGDWRDFLAELKRQLAQWGDADD